MMIIETKLVTVLGYRYGYYTYNYQNQKMSIRFLSVCVGSYNIMTCRPMCVKIAEYNWLLFTRKRFSLFFFSFDVGKLLFPLCM